MKNKRLLHPKEAAEELGISLRTLIRSRSGGEITYHTDCWQSTAGTDGGNLPVAQAGRSAGPAMHYLCAGIEREARTGWPSGSANGTLERGSGYARGYEIVTVIDSASLCSQRAAARDEKTTGARGRAGGRCRAHRVSRSPGALWV